jgi:mRNA interferase MazF
MTYIPERGDAIWISFNPQAGHEQAGHRPALVLSLSTYNSKTSLCLLCPITSQVKNYPFEVVIPDNPAIKGVILSDQIKSLDWQARKAQFITKLPDLTMAQVLKKLKLLLF